MKNLNMAKQRLSLPKCAAFSQAPPRWGGVGEEVLKEGEGQQKTSAIHLTALKRLIQNMFLIALFFFAVTSLFGQRDRPLEVTLLDGHKVCLYERHTLDGPDAGRMYRKSSLF